MESRISRRAPLCVAVLSLGLVVTGASLGAAPAEPAGPPPTSPAARGAAPVTATSCKDLRKRLVKQNVKAVGPRGWKYRWLAQRESFTNDTEEAFGVLSKLGYPHERLETSPADTPQEPGLDEPDIAKAEGTVLTRVDGRRLRTWDMGGAKAKPLGTLKLRKGLVDPRLLVAGDRAVVLADNKIREHSEDRAQTHVLTVDLTDPTSPRLVERRSYDGRLVSARLHGGTARLVISSSLPDLPFVKAGRKHTEKQARRANRRVLRRARIDAWLPKVKVGGRKPTPYVGCSDVAISPERNGPIFASVVGLPLARPKQAETTTMVTTARVAYTSGDRLYLVGGVRAGVAQRKPAVRPVFPASEVHAFELGAVGSELVAHGRFEGRVRDRHWLDRDGDVLRVLRTGTRAGGDASVVTLREQGGALVEAGRLTDVGGRAKVLGTAWSGDRLVFSTDTGADDTLHLVDLSEATAPVLVGTSQRPGELASFYRAGASRVLSWGSGGTGYRDEAAVHDVAGADGPHELDRVAWGNSSFWNPSFLPRRFAWVEDRSTALAFGWRKKSSGIAVAEVGAEGRITKGFVPLGRVAFDTGRILRLDDGRVVLTHRRGSVQLSW